MPVDLSTIRCPSCGAPITFVPTNTVKCESCGIVNVLPEYDQRQVGDKIEGFEFRISAEEAKKRAVVYIGQGMLTPGDLVMATRATLIPQPLLVPVWIYKMMIGCTWSAEIGDQKIVQEQTFVTPTRGKQRHVTSSKVTVSWSGRQGTTTELFDGQVVAAAEGEWTVATSLARAHHEEAKPLDMTLMATTVVETTVASTAARDSVFKRVSSIAVAHCIAHIPGPLKRNVVVTPSITTVERKTVYVPIWVMTYKYQGTDWSVIVDGLLGGVTGSRPVSPQRVVGLIVVGGAAFVIFMCFGILNDTSHRGAGQNGSTVSTSSTATLPPEVPASNIPTGGIVEEIGAPPSSPWDDPAIVKLDPSNHDFSDRFWSMFDELSKLREDAAIKKLKEDHPATWQSNLASVKKQVTMERAMAQKVLLTTTFVYAVPETLFLPSYDAKVGGFKAVLEGVKPINMEPFGGNSGWTLAFEKPPQSTQELISNLPSENGGTLKTYKYNFTGGKPLSIFLPMAQSDADAFYKANQGSLNIVIMFRLKSVVQDKPHPEHGGNVLSRKGQGSGLDDAANSVLRNAMTDAGKALVVHVTAWRVHTMDGVVIASWGP